MPTPASPGPPNGSPRLSIAPDQSVPPIPCDDCGFNSLHVAHVLDANGRVLATVLVCTRCRAREQAREQQH